MKIYFACSIRGGREKSADYAVLVEHMKEFGTVLSELFADQSLKATDVLDTSTNLRQRCLAWIDEADVVIAEVTTPSLGVGFELATAEQLGKPTLALFQKGERNLSAMVDGSERMTVVHYSELDQARQAITDFLSQQTE